MGTPLFDIKAVKAAAQKQVADERATKAKDALVRQMRILQAAEDVVTAEKSKLDDIEQQINEGTF